MQVQISSRESILGEMSGVEMKCQAAMSQAASIADQLTHLEVNGEYVMYIHCTTRTRVSLSCMYRLAQPLPLHLPLVPRVRITKLHFIIGTL